MVESGSDQPGVDDVSLRLFGVLLLAVCVADASAQGFDCNTPATPTRWSARWCSAIVSPRHARATAGGAGCEQRHPAQHQQRHAGAGCHAANHPRSSDRRAAAQRLRWQCATVIEISNPQLANYDILLKNLILRDGDARTASGDEFACPVAPSSTTTAASPGVPVGLQAFDVQFIANRAIDAQDGGGGGVYLLGMREFVCVRCRFEGNQGSNGAGFYGLGTQTIRFYDSLFLGNLTTGDGGNPGSGGNGGGLPSMVPSVNSACAGPRWPNNHANAFGAGLFTTVYDQTSMTRIWQSSLIGNIQDGNDQHTGAPTSRAGRCRSATAPSPTTAPMAMADCPCSITTGAGLITSGGEIVSSTFVGNIARDGLGGAMNLQGTAPLLLQNLTIAGNRARCAASALPAASPMVRTGLITLRNSIFFDNTGGNAFNPWALLNPVQAGSNNIQFPQVRPNSFGQQELPVTLIRSMPMPAGAASPTMAGPPRPWH